MPDQSKQVVIHTALREQTSCDDCAFYLWQHVNALTHLSAQGLIDAIESFFRDLDIVGLQVRYPTGESWPIPCIDDVFPCVESEAGRRWINWYRKEFRGGVHPHAKQVIWDRMVCIELMVHGTVAKYTCGPNTPRCSMTHFPLGW